MTDMYYSFYSKNTSIWSPPMITKSSCRSTNRWIHSISCHSLKTRRVWDTTNYHPPRSINNTHILPIPHIIIMRYSHNQFHLLATNRYEISYRLLFSQPHGLSNYCYYTSNTMKFYRGTHPNNRPRPNLLNTFLSSKFKLRAHS